MDSKGYLKKADFGSFWNDVFKIWSDFSENLSTAPENILSQPLWYNENIEIDKAPIFLKKLSCCDIFYVNDIIDSAGNIMNFDLMKNCYNLEIDTLTYNSLISSIPRDWKRIIKNYGKN